MDAERYSTARAIIFIVWCIGFIFNNDIICIISAVGAGLTLLFMIIGFFNNARKEKTIKQLVYQAIFSICIIAMCGYILLS